MASDDKLKRTIKIENMEMRQSPPKAIVDCSPLQPAISKNKEALKIKLMVRRPIAQLVDQGIIPSLKSSPALHEQRKQLERAKTGDILKAKIQQRPARQELEQRHILEHDEGHVDPSLAERQRMLKKARLADQLNSQLSHRPGPLELIKKNILHTEEPIERIVKEGLISFKATSEGLLNRPQQPNGYITFEDDSQSSEGDQLNSPAGQDSNEAIATTSAAIIPLTLNENNISTKAAAAVANTISSSSSSVANNSNTLISVVSKPLPPAYYAPIESPAPSQAKPAAETFQVKPETSNLFAELCQSVIDNTTSLNYVGQQQKGGQRSVTSLPSLTASGLQAFPTPVQNINKCDAPGKDKNRKKNKLKPITKTRTIKFHEYKGPPNAQKNGGSTISTEETSYQLLLKQQNCLLEYLEGLHKNIPASAAAAAASIKSAPAETQTFSMTNNFMQQPSPVASNSGALKQPSSPASSTGSVAGASTTTGTASAVTDPANIDLSKLEKMKVSDLKLLLKTRNLPVSGPKPQLIERLRPYIQQQNDASDATTSDNGAIDDDTESTSRISPIQMETDANEMHDLTKTKTNAELLREQQRKIDELQRKLKESQQELQQMQMKQCQPSTVILTTQTTADVVVPNKPELLNQKQIFKQQLEAKIQKDKLQKLENLQKMQMEQQQQQQQLHQQLKQQESQRKKQENIVKINQETITPKPVISTNFIGQSAKAPNEFVWNGESTILLVNFPDDKKYVLSSNPQATTATMQNFLVPITTNSSNINAIVKKINLSAQIQQQQQQQIQPPPPPPPPAPTNLHLTQISAPKSSSHPMNVNVIANKSLNVNKLQNVLGQQQQQQHQTLPSINSAITMVNAANQSLHNSSNQPSNDILLNNVSTTHPFNVQPSASIKKEYSLFDASSSSATDSTMIPNDLLLSANAMDTMSPMQQHDDSCNSFDLFLSEAAQSHSDAAKLQDQHDKVSAMNVKKEPSTMVPSMSTSVDPCNVDLKTFDDLELMELMSQQLDMDISDDSCQPMTGIKDELIDRVGAGGMSHSQPSSNMMTSCRREMNPSLQPSLSELIQQQQQQQHQHHHQQQSAPNQLRPQQQQQTLNSHISNHRSNNASDTNNNLSSSLDSNPNNNLIDYSSPFYLNSQSNPMSMSASSGLHLGSMDIEYFDNTLAQFDFALPPVTTPLSTPHQTSTSTSMNFESSGNNGGCTATDQQLMHALNASNNLMSSPSTYYPNTSSTMNNHVLDLFNIDDFKMSGDSLPWSEVDYAV